MNPELIAIVGSTAVGKTAYAIELAQRSGGEIISADSRQIYRQMNIGTAKPSPAELAAVPHHLIDICDPDADFSLATYQELARVGRPVGKVAAAAQAVQRHNKLAPPDD